MVSAEAKKLASDAELVSLNTGSDISLDGFSHSWMYYFKSESKKMIYQFNYEGDNNKVSRIEPVMLDDSEYPGPLY